MIIKKYSEAATKDDLRNMLFALTQVIESHISSASMIHTSLYNETLMQLKRMEESNSE
jgi:hypothetical protein